GATGSLVPQYKNITLRNVHATTEGRVNIQGHDAGAITTITLDNVQLDNVKASDIMQQNVAYTLGPGPVNFAGLLRGTGVTVTDQQSGAGSVYACPPETFSPIGAELIPGPARIDFGQALTLQVQVFATKAIPYQTYL